MIDLTTPRHSQSFDATYARCDVNCGRFGAVQARLVKFDGDPIATTTVDAAFTELAEIRLTVSLELGVWFWGSLHNVEASGGVPSNPDHQAAAYGGKGGSESFSAALSGGTSCFSCGEQHVLLGQLVSTFDTPSTCGNEGAITLSTVRLIHPITNVTKKNGQFDLRLEKSSAARPFPCSTFVEKVLFQSRDFHNLPAVHTPRQHRAFLTKMQVQHVSIRKPTVLHPAK